MTKGKQEKAKNVCGQLAELYKKKLLPLENSYRFHEFHSPPLAPGDFTAKPMILLLGQYSTGKTTFIKHLLGQDFPGMRIGPEPTTDGFIIVMHGETEGTVPGNALVSDSSKPFTPLSKFGNAFLTRLQCSQVKSTVLENMTIIDTPGILSGEKQRIDRGYDYPKVIEWMAEHVDRIILLFDAHKLDISDEFKRVIESLRGYDEKVRIVLNKADRINTQQLMRVYGALMWGLGKVLGTPEVARVYIGSFWDQPLVFSDNRKLFDLEQKDLLDDLGSLPSQSALRKLNDLIRRARLAKVHVFIISSLKQKMPVFGKNKKKNELIDNLFSLFEGISRDQNISIGDFPNIEKMKSILNEKDFSTFITMKPKLIQEVDKMLEQDIPNLMSQLNEEIKVMVDLKKDIVIGGAFQPEQDNPFGAESVFGVNEGKFSGTTWIVDKYREKFDNEFYTLDVIDGKVSGSQAREIMIKSQLPQTSLRQIWSLSDLDNDGMLDIDEYALAQYLIRLKLEGEELPNQLPAHLIPPSKRKLVSL